MRLKKYITESLLVTYEAGKKTRAVYRNPSREEVKALSEEEGDKYFKFIACATDKSLLIFGTYVQHANMHDALKNNGKLPSGAKGHLRQTFSTPHGPGSLVGSEDFVAGYIEADNAGNMWVVEPQAGIKWDQYDFETKDWSFLSRYFMNYTSWIRIMTRLKKK